MISRFKANFPANQTNQRVGLSDRKEKIMNKQEITQASFLESKELRDGAMERIEVLSKVKQLFLLPGLDCMTVKQLADYYEVDVETIKKQYQRNKDELDSDGACLKTIADFKILNGTLCPIKNLAQQNGKMTVTFKDNLEIIVPNRGIKCFPKRAILRMGMLLRGSEIAKEVRTQLLNTFEHSTEQQRTAEIDEETALLNGIGQAFGTGSGIEILQACMQLDCYRKRYIQEIEQNNIDLVQENKKIIKQKEEIENTNKALAAENHILATNILKWTDRASANRIVRVLASKAFHGDFKMAYNIIYKELLYKFGINTNKRSTYDNRKKPKISYIQENEWICFYKVIIALCEQNNINAQRLFKDAKIDISSLDLS